MLNIGLALATVARFHWACRTSGWARRGRWDERPAYANHIVSACREAGMDISTRHAFAQQWALDEGGTGPLAVVS